MGKRALLSQKNSGPLGKTAGVIQASRSKPCSFPRRTHSTQRRDCGYISSGAKSFTLGQSVG
ncbi:MAG: hypothetical protein E5Y81_12225, partial [Mesorhizobium sp.]